MLIAQGILARRCQNRTIELLLSARNGIFDNITTPMTDEDATEFALVTSSQGYNATEQALTGEATVSGRYRLSTEYCAPNSTNSTGQGPVLQILTHGLGYDKQYWDFTYHNYNYSYVEHALSHGYHTLSYDRLGTGNSSHGEPKNEIQTNLELAALAQLTRMVRNGSYPGIRRPKSIIHVGHSYGSVQTYDLSAMYPDISDALVLTAFSLNLSFFDLFTAGGNWQQASSSNQSSSYYPPGYLATADADADQYLFLRAPWFDPNILTYVENIKKPITVGELLTIASVPTTSDFKGPVLVLTASNDLPFCGGDCYNTGGSGESVPEGVKKSFPNSKAFHAQIQPNMGHGINLHYNASGAYNYIATWLKASGMGP
ncbi:hypothetical protein FE257_008505 [Aspergillus nanangensis]|uniref:AB hydrolase-1 domain-containing protein n=1 Tax=Aspergillus nanangensis TaxID=2582783 RepID=A0AAD4CMN7_ASPNN|nr:hypothetical protein FE257_008505 [Aspergillus nanangensis]